jgi:hypothetical protein
MTGAEQDARTISASTSSRTQVTVHPALCLRQHSSSATVNDDTGAPVIITAFIDHDSIESLRAVVAGFDSISESVIHRYRLRLVVTEGGDGDFARSVVSMAHHSSQIDLDSGPKAPAEIEVIARESSIVITSHLSRESPAARGAVQSGIGLIVLDEDADLIPLAEYMGAVGAISSSVASVHVAIEHSVRRLGLHFPSEDTLQSLADELTSLVVPSSRIAQP